MGIMSTAETGPSSGGGMSSETAGAVGGGIGALGGVVGYLASADSRRAQRDAQSMAIGELLKIPNPPEAVRLALEKYKVEGVLTPELEQVVNEKASEMAKVKADQDAVDTSKQALELMKKEATVGLSPEERNQQMLLQDQAAKDSQARNQAIQQNLAQRGQAGAGTELAMQLAESQAGAQQSAQNARDLSTVASQRKQSALANLGNYSNQLRQQSFGEAGARAQAQDITNRFDVENQRNVQQRNIGAKNQAQQYNLGTAQRIGEKNVDVQHDVEKDYQRQKQQQWENQLNLGQVRSRAYNKQGANAGAAAQGTADMWSGIGQSAGGIASLAMMSDERAKTDVKDFDTKKFLDSLTSKEYKYKDEKNGEGKQIGVMAQDVEKEAPQIIAEDNNGMKHIDTTKATGPILASLADINERLKKFETVNASRGAYVGGVAKVSGDSPKNDLVDAKLSPGEIVIPRSIVNHKNAGTKAKNFVEAMIAKHGDEIEKNKPSDLERYKAFFDKKKEPKKFAYGGMTEDLDANSSTMEEPSNEFQYTPEPEIEKQKQLLADYYKSKGITSSGIGGQDVDKLASDKLQEIQSYKKNPNSFSSSGEANLKEYIDASSPKQTERAPSSVDESSPYVGMADSLPSRSGSELTMVAPKIEEAKPSTTPMSKTIKSESSESSPVSQVPVAASPKLETSEPNIVDLLKKAQEESDSRARGASYLKLGSQLGNAIARTPQVKVGEETADDLMKRANQPVENIKTVQSVEEKSLDSALKKAKLATDKERKDPNSTVSKLVQHELSKYGVKNIMGTPIENVSAEAGEKMIESIRKHEEFKQTTEVNKEKIGLLRDQRKSIQDDKQIAARKKEVDSVRKDLMAPYSARQTTPIGSAQATVNRAEAADALLSGDKLNHTQIEEMARSLDTILRGGGSSAATIKGLIPRGIKDDINKVRDWFTSSPNSSDRAPLVKVYRSLIERERAVAQNRLDEYRTNVIMGKKELLDGGELDDYLDQFKIRDAVYKKREDQLNRKSDKISTKESQTSSRALKSPLTSSQSEKIRIFMEKNKKITDPAEAEKILRDNGKL